MSAPAAIEGCPSAQTGKLRFVVERGDRHDHAAQSGRLVAAEIVHDDDVAGLEERHELLFDIGAKAFAVDGTIEHTRGDEPVAAQRAEECQRPPMAMRRKTPHTVALRPPSTQRRYIGLDPSLVDEDQTAGVETGLP
jgi:hypothetical protein